MHVCFGRLNIMTSRDRDRGRKYLSGNEKLKRKLKKEEYLETQRNSMCKFLKRENTDNIQSEQLHEEKTTNHQNDNDDYICERFIDVHDNNVLDVDDMKNDDILNNKIIDINDPGTWPEKITDKFRMNLIKNGPIQIYNFNFPKDEEKGNRSFSVNYYKRKLPNSVEQVRRWLVYSKTTNKIFCFACKLFKTYVDTSALNTNGFCDWIHLSERLKMHERSSNYLLSMKTWLETEKNLKLNNTIDKEYEKFVENETTRWKNIFQRIIAAILYLAEHNMAFRGENDKLYESHNGNFLGLIELMAKFDPVLKEHILTSNNSKVLGAKRGHTYLSHSIQDELITRMAEKVKFKIINSIKQSKYYSILLDCTPDISHQEQLSVIIRYVEIEDNLIEIQERFICFEIVNDTTGEGLSNKIININVLNLEGLSISDCRGQGYDNGANMKGIYKDVQSHIIRQNPKAFFTP